MLNDTNKNSEKNNKKDPLSKEIGEVKEIKIRISKAKGYEKHYCILGINDIREAEFNKGEEIEITEKELKIIGYHRWLEVINGTEQI